MDLLLEHVREFSHGAEFDALLQEGIPSSNQHQLFNPDSMPLAEGWWLLALMVMIIQAGFGIKYH